MHCTRQPFFFKYTHTNTEFLLNALDYYKNKITRNIKKKKKKAPKASLVNFAFRGILVIVYFEKK